MIVRANPIEVRIESEDVFAAGMEFAAKVRRERARLGLGRARIAVEAVGSPRSMACLHVQIADAMGAWGIGVLLLRAEGRT